jgi:glycosyltransferase involved in cell wall biosynthesis
MPFLSMGGSEAVLSQLCRQLKQLGFRILVYTTLPTGETQGDTTSWFEDCCAGIYHLPRFLDIEHWPAFIAYLIQQHGVSVLWQVGSAYTYDLLPILRELFPELAIVDLLFNISGHTVNHLKYDYLIDHAVTEHSGVRDWLVSRGVPEEHISVIPNGVDLGLYSPQPKVNRRTLQPRTAGDGRFVAAFFGRFSEEKAPDVFLKTAALLADEPAIEFMLCGAGPMEASLRLEAAGSGLAGRVDFPGFVSVREYLPYCDAVVVCSRLDGRPNIILESQAMGIPVIASRVGGIPEMLPPGDEDLLCEPAKPDAFAAAIRLLARDSHRYRRSAEAARQHVEKNVRFAESGRAYAQLFEDLRRKRQALGRHLTPEAVAASLGYERDPSSALRSKFPLLRRGLLRNALLLWKLRSSGQETRLRELFDADYYCRQFPGARKWRLSPLLHYVLLGFRDGRNPSPAFDTRYYLTAYPDVRQGGWNPLLHFVMWGEQEGRLTTLRPAKSR